VAAIEVPLGAAAAAKAWTAVAVDDPSDRVRLQIVPARPDTRALHAHMVGVRQATPDTVAAATGVFEGRVPGAGWRAWRVEPDADGTAAAPQSTCAAFPANCTDAGGDAITVTNGFVTLTFSRAAGGLTSVHPVGGRPVAVRPTLRRYTHHLDTHVLPWFLRRSGHYAFHPAGDSEDMGGEGGGGGGATLDIVAGPSVVMVARRVGAYASLAVRLRAGSPAPELEWTVGRCRPRRTWS
jgi:hypothetical protein